MSRPQPSSDGARTDDQIALERAKGEVSDVLLNIEHALDRAKKARKTVAKDGVDSKAELALVRRQQAWNACASGCSRTPTSRATTCA